MDVEDKILELLDQGNTLFNKFYYTEALLLYHEARELSDLRPADMETRADVEHNVGYSYLQLGRYHQAEEALRKSLVIARKTTNNTAEIAITLTALGQCLRLQKKYSACEDVLKQALDIEKKLPRDQPSTAWTLLQMGRCLVDQRRNLEGKTYLQRSLKINKKTLGSTHRHTADTLYTLGICMGELGLLEAGLKELKEALLARKASYGVSHINVGWVLYWRGVFLNRMSDFGEAEGELRRAQSIAHQHNLLPSHSLCMKVQQELERSVDRRSCNTPGQRQGSPVIRVHNSNNDKGLMSSATSPATSTPRSPSYSNQRHTSYSSSRSSPQDMPQTSSRVSKQSEMTMFRPSDLPMKFKQSMPNVAVGSVASLDTGYLSLSRSQSSVFSSSFSLLESTWSLHSSRNNQPRSRHSMVCQSDLISRLSEAPEESDEGLITNVRLLRNRSEPDILKVSYDSAAEVSAGLDGPLLSLIQPDGVHWSGGTLEMMVIENRSRSVLTSFSSVLGASGGRCGSDNVFVRVPTGAVTMPTKVSIRVYSDVSLMPPIQSDDEETFISPLTHVSLSPSRFKQPVELYLPVNVPLVSSMTSSGWLLELKICDSSYQNKPRDWYTALEFNTNTGIVTTHSQSLTFNPQRQVICLNRFCWICWVGRPLGTPSLGLRKVSYALFGKRLEQHKWTVSLHIMHGSNIVYEEILRRLKEQRYVPLTPPMQQTIGLRGLVSLKLQCSHPWVATHATEARIPTNTIWDVPINGSLYYTATVEDPTLSSNYLDCTMSASFKGDWLDVGDDVTFSVFHPVGSDQHQAVVCPKSMVANFTFSHITGLAFGANAQLFILPPVHRDIRKTVTSRFPDVCITRNSEIIPQHISLGIPVRLAIQLALSEKPVTSTDDCFVQFVSDQRDIDIVERPCLRVNDRELDVLCPAWPVSGRVFVRVVTSTQLEELGVGFITVGDFRL